MSTPFVLDNSLPPVSPGATRITQRIEVPVKQQIRIQERQIRVPKIYVTENVQRIEKTRKICRVVKKKVLVDEVEFQEELYHPEVYVDKIRPVLDVVFQHEIKKRPVVHYVVRDPHHPEVAHIAATEKPNEKGGRTHIVCNNAVHTVTVPCIKFREVRKPRVFAPLKQVAGKIVYNFIDRKTKAALDPSTTEIVKQQTDHTVLRELTRQVPQSFVKSYYERPVRVEVPGPIQTVWVDEISEVQDPELERAYREWEANGKEGPVRVKRIDYVIEEEVRQIPIDGIIKEVIPDTEYIINTKNIETVQDVIRYVEVDDIKADELNLPRHERPTIVCGANDVVIIDPKPDDVEIINLPPIIENGPPRYVIDKRENPEIESKIDDFYFIVDENEADVNFKVLEAQGQIQLQSGYFQGKEEIFTSEEFNQRVQEILAKQELENSNAIQAAIQRAEATETQSYGNPTYPLSHVAPQSPNFVPLVGPGYQTISPPPQYIPAPGAVSLIGPGGRLMPFPVPQQPQVQN